MKNTPYIVILSKEPNIQIDADEVPVIINALQRKQITRVRQGIFNPSYFVSIVIDQKRQSLFIDDIKYDNNRVALRNRGVQRLSDIFEGIDLKKNLLGQSEPLALDGG